MVALDARDLTRVLLVMFAAALRYPFTGYYYVRQQTGCRGRTRD